MPRCVVHFLFFFISIGAWAQPVQGPLLELPYYFNASTLEKSRGSRTEAAPVSVKPYIQIGIVSGQNPSCLSDVSPIIFTAKGFNLGSVSGVNWYVNGNFITSGSSFLLLNGGSNGDEIQARAVATLPCASPQEAVSNIITIIKSDTLRPQVAIEIISGSNPACTPFEPITLRAKGVHAGALPSFRWFIDTLEVSGGLADTLRLDTLANNRQVTVRMRSGLACAGATEVSSIPLRRSIVRSVLPVAELRVVAVEADPGCSEIRYQLQANVSRQGPNPTYSWRRNGMELFTTTSPMAEVLLSNNGDFVEVVLTSDLVCANPKAVASNRIIRLDTLTLPFFDDFSYYRKLPDKNRWIENEGVVISGFYPVEPPTYHAAVFDGLRTNGTPYDSVNTNTRGITDRLTSLPIDLSTVTNASGTALTFFWQPQGRGEAPDSASGDRLALFFRNQEGIWVQVWQAVGRSLQPFRQVVVPIKSDAQNNYFYKGFQFRFEARGRLTGNFDHFLIDYVYLGQDLPETIPISFNDQSFEMPTGSILKTYQSIPLRHILMQSNPAALFVDTIQTHLNNLSETFNSLSIRRGTKEYFEALTARSEVVLPTLRIEANQKKLPVSIPVDKSFITELRPDQDYVLQNLSILTGDADFLPPRFAPFTTNNTLIGTTILSNYYAYDDGTAEYALSLNQKFSSLAVRFDILQPDTLCQIAIAFVKTVRVHNAQSFNLKLFKKLPELGANPAQEDILYEQNVVLRYRNQVDGWTVYTLPQPLVLDGTFYIVMQQVSDDMISVGWDRNTANNDKIYYNVDGPWVNYSTDTLASNGSLMIRPVFGTYRHLTKRETKQIINKTSVPSTLVYPNPSYDQLCFELIPEKAVWYDASGNMLMEQTNPNQCQNTSYLKSGLYLIRLKYPGTWKQVKWIKY